MQEGGTDVVVIAGAAMPLGGWPKVICGVVARANAAGVEVRRRGEGQRRKRRKGLLKGAARSGAACCEGGGVLVLRVTRSRGRGRGMALLVMVLVLEGGVVGGRG